MRVFYWMALAMDWIIALAWLHRVLRWRRMLPTVPDLVHTSYAGSSRKLPSLSVIVPARNEARNIAPTLRSLIAAQGVALEIIAVDDRSTDETGAIMQAVREEVGEAAGKLLQVLRVTELPAGWLGKTHAMALGAQHATGEWLLFTDADVLFQPDALRRALDYATWSGGDHMVLLPTILLQTPGERMMVSFLQTVSVWALCPWRVADPLARDSIGVGAFNMLRREVYDALGGWEALRLEVLEDLALGRRVKSRGFAQRAAFGLDLVSVRWAEGAFGVVDNLSKNVFALFRFRPELLLGSVCGGLGLFTLFPLAACLAGRAFCWPGAVFLVALILAYQRAGQYHHYSALQVVTFPLASLLLLYAMLRSMLLALWRGGITWRGTFYSLEELRQRAGQS